ncbi:hypothetical protein [Paenarthrobacter sp. PH39-S1]|uniref:hypothetical protein n=1 Tax=Paenarthrobacter sp. PH39-S1 TaxID=3046204 RepID=UPI0024BAF799|nr:hypothetical protein [Paenarthrobacter sp. PH39-S1]MDJ0356555.1 hypothetical protein [Paenarthrobacter sp. PH39-S1]
MTNSSDAPGPDPDGNGGRSLGPDGGAGQSRSGVGPSRGRVTRKKGLIIGGGAAAAVVAVVVAASLTLGGNSPQAAGTSAPASSSAVTTSASASAPATAAKTFAPFDRPEYVQAGAAAGAVNPIASTTVSVTDQALGTAMPDGLMGLSFETDVMTDPRFDPANSNLTAVLAHMNKPVIRFGGQSVDRRFFWTSTDEPIPNWKLVPAFSGDTRPILKVTPADLQRIKKVADASNATVVLTADLGHFDPARAADLALNAKKILGDRLQGMTMGNEPNGYYGEGRDYMTIRGSDYGFPEYQKELMAYVSAVTAAVPDLKIIGPDVYSEEWWKQFVAAKVPNLAALSYHNYPMSACKTTGQSDSPTIATAMSRQRAQQSLDFQAVVVDLAKKANVPAWLTETGVSSCDGGNETTKKHVSALWTFNYAVGAAQIGVSQVDMHSGLDACKGGPPLSPICDSGPYKKPNGIITMQPAYYGMMLANSIGAGAFQKVDTSGNENVYGYSVKHDDGSMSVVVVNQNDPAKDAQAPVSIQLPAQAATATMSQMTGPSFDAEAQTRIDGLESAGVPKDTQGRIPGFTAGDKSVTLPVTSGTATVFTFTF